MSHVINAEAHHDCQVCGRSILPGAQHTQIVGGVQQFFHREHCPDERCIPGTLLGQSE